MHLLACCVPQFAAMPGRPERDTHQIRNGHEGAAAVENLVANLLAALHQPAVVEFVQRVFGIPLVAVKLGFGQG